MFSGKGALKGPLFLFPVLKNPEEIRAVSETAHFKDFKLGPAPALRGWLDGDIYVDEYKPDNDKRTAEPAYVLEGTSPVFRMDNRQFEEYHEKAR